MLLMEQTIVPGAALPVQAFKEHLRLGTGFADDDVQDALAESYLRAALAAVEGRTGKALLAREFLLVLTDWRSGEGQALPVAPVSSVVSVVLKDATGAPTPLAPAAYRLVRDMHRPRIVPVGASLPSPVHGGSVEIAFTAGFGPAWDDVPHDLTQAVFLLAAQFHENRHDASERAAVLPFGVLGLIERWRTVRVLGGGQA